MHTIDQILIVNYGEGSIDKIFISSFELICKYFS